MTSKLFSQILLAAFALSIFLEVPAFADCATAAPPKAVAPAVPLVMGKWPADALVQTPTVHVAYSKDVLIRVIQHDDYQLVGVYGVIFKQDQSVIDDAAKYLIPNKHIIVSVDFGGGTTGPILSLAQKLRDACSVGHGCSIEMQLPTGHRCASNCVTFFMFGQVRTAFSDSNFGFHSATLAGAEMHGMAENKLRDVGVNPTWLNQHAADFATVKITNIQPEGLRGSNIVTRIFQSPPKPIAMTLNIPQSCSRNPLK